MPPLTYDGAEREEPSLLVLFRVATEVEQSSREAAFFVPMQRQQLLAGSLPIDPNNPSPHQW